jgi:hypothetical protein
MLGRAQAADDISISRTFALALQALFRLPVTALLLSAVTITLPSELFYRLVPYQEFAFSWPFAFYTLGSIAIGSTQAFVFAWIALVFVGASTAPIVETIRRAPVLIVTNFIVLFVAMLGTLAFVVPGITWSLATAVAIPALAVERLGAVRAMRRSVDLTWGRLLVLFVIFLALMLPLLIVIWLAEFWFNNLQLAPVEGSTFTASVTATVGQTLVALWGAALSAALYVELTRVHVEAAALNEEQARLTPPQ